MNRAINIKNTYLLIIIVIGLIILSSYSTYALFSDSIETDEVVNINVIDLKINIDDFNTYNQIDLKPHEKKSILLKISNSTNFLNYYKVWYKLVDSIQNNEYVKIYKSKNSLYNTNGTININNNLEIELIIVNYSNKNLSINLGLNTSSKNDIVLEENKKEILDVEEEFNNIKKVWSLENGDFISGKCTMFSMKDKASGVYKIELANNENYISGTVFLNNDKNLYVCLGDKDIENNHSEILIKEPNIDWKYDKDYKNKLFFVNSTDSFALTKSAYNELVESNDNYKIDNVNDYFIMNVNKETNNIYSDNYAKITLIYPFNNKTNNLNIDKLFIDGVLSNYPTKGTYYMTNYECDNINTNLYWDNKNYRISSNYINQSDTCDVYLSTSKKLLSSVKQGDYIDYIGVGGIVNNKEAKCSDEECLAKVKSCDNDNFDDFGWTLAYTINDGNKIIPYLISKNITDCINNSVNIEQLNNLSIKYCNEDFIYGNNCNKDNSSVNIWAFNNKDFERIINNGQTYNNCLNLNYTSDLCGFNNDIININGKYSIINNSQINYFNNEFNGLSNQKINNYGLRVVVKIDPETKIISGDGSKENPYKICNKEEC